MEEYRTRKRKGSRIAILSRKEESTHINIFVPNRLLDSPLPLTNFFFCYPGYLGYLPQRRPPPPLLQYKALCTARSSDLVQTVYMTIFNAPGDRRVKNNSKQNRQIQLRCRELVASSTGRNINDISNSLYQLPLSIWYANV